MCMYIVTVTYCEAATENVKLNEIHSYLGHGCHTMAFFFVMPMDKGLSNHNDFFYGGFD